MACRIARAPLLGTYQGGVVQRRKDCKDTALAVYVAYLHTNNKIVLDSATRGRALMYAETFYSSAMQSQIAPAPPSIWNPRPGALAAANGSCTPLSSGASGTRVDGLSASTPATTMTASAWSDRAASAPPQSTAPGRGTPSTPQKPVWSPNFPRSADQHAPTSAAATATPAQHEPRHGHWWSSTVSAASAPALGTFLPSPVCPLLPAVCR